MKVNIFNLTIYNKKNFITDVDIISRDDRAIAVLKSGNNILEEVELYLFFNQVDTWDADRVLEDLKDRKTISLKSDKKDFDLLFSRIFNKRVDSFSYIRNIPEIYESLNSFYSFTFSDGSTLAMNENELAQRCKVWMTKRKDFSVKENEASIELIGIRENVLENKTFPEDSYGSEYPPSRVLEAAKWVSNNY